MKAKVKATGEIVDVLPYAEKDGTIRFYANMEDKWHEAYDIDLVSDTLSPDYWDKLCHQYAGQFLQGILIGKIFARDYVEEAYKYATALVGKLKNEK